MSKFWCYPAVAGSAAVIALTASATGVFAAPQATHHDVRVAQAAATQSPATAQPSARAPEHSPAQTASQPTGSIGKPAASSDALTSGGSIVTTDTPVGAQLKDLIANRLDRAITRKGDRDDVRDFYRASGYASMWIGNGGPNARAQAVIAVMKSADVDGLDPASYAIPDFDAARGDPAKLAAAELALTDAVLTYARHAQAGRFGAQRMTVELEVKQTLPDAGAVLKIIAQAPNAATTLNGYNPRHSGYQALKAKLAALRGGAAKTGRIVIPDGPSLKRGMTDSRIPLLRRRLNVAGNKSSSTFDDALVAAVRAFQRDANLHPDGVVGPQ
jgi:murein L,D-transpeptidase YcbB/YkuD